MQVTGTPAEPIENVTSEIEREATPKPFVLSDMSDDTGLSIE